MPDERASDWQESGDFAQCELNSADNQSYGGISEKGAEGASSLYRAPKSQEKACALLVVSQELAIWKQRTMAPASAIKLIWRWCKPRDSFCSSMAVRKSPS